MRELAVKERVIVDLFLKMTRCREIQRSSFDYNPIELLYLVHHQNLGGEIFPILGTISPIPFGYF
jgi:hypothetical protein